MLLNSSHPSTILHTLDGDKAANTLQHTLDGDKAANTLLRTLDSDKAASCLAQTQLFLTRSAQTSTTLYY